MDVELTFQKKVAQKRGPAPYETPNVTRFRTGHLAEVLALSSSGDCGAPPSSGCLVCGRDAVGDLHLWRHLPPRVPF